MSYVRRPMNNLGKILVIAGLIITLLGVMVLFFFRVKIPFLGKLPGDIFIQRRNFTFYFPIATSIIISMILSIIFYFISKK